MLVFIPAFRSIRLHAHTESRQSDSRIFAIDASENREQPGRYGGGIDTVAEQVAKFGAPAVLVARTGTPKHVNPSQRSAACDRSYSTQPLRSHVRRSAYMRGSIKKRYEGSWSLILELGSSPIRRPAR